jgi:hypothetical protein
MSHPTVHVLLYGLFAGFSALAFAAAIAVMQAGRLKALGFGVGFVGAQAFTCSLFVILGIAITGATKKSHPALHAGIELFLALVLLVAAAQIRRRPPSEERRSSERTAAFLDRLTRLRFLTTVAVGVVLGIGGPKRLVLTALAATAITTAGIRDSGEAALVILYLALATALVWVPVVLFVLLGTGAVGLMTRIQREIARRQPHVTVYALLVFATLFVLDAVVLLL